MQENLMSQGVELLVFGMGTVVLFLALLVVLTNLMSTLIQKIAPETPTSQSKPKTAAAQQKTSAMDDAQLLAVISAAIKAHRTRQK